jgi:ectoine hydroxylase-related dioxygenase (phytanoyl-CoA dioxygenase family)
MGGLSTDQVNRFRDAGYLVVPGLLNDATVVAPIIADFEDRLDAIVAERVARGDLAPAPGDLPFADRVKWLYRESKDIFAQNFNISVPARAGIPADTPIFLPESVFAALHDPDLLDAVETLIGPEISINPIQHVRIKPPQALVERSTVGTVNAAVGINKHNGLVSRTPWHQDNAVCTPDADATEMLTVWFPLTSASVEKGCLQVVPGSHTSGLRAHYRQESNREITLSALPDVEPVALPMEPGDVLFLHRQTCHASLPNRGDTVRWSLDLRFHPTGQPSGRAALPSFVARSRRDPANEVRDIGAWRAGWRSAIAALAADPSAPAPSRWG